MRTEPRVVSARRRSSIIATMVVIGLASGMASIQSASAAMISECEQTILYNVSTPPDNVPAEDRAFSGVWVGMLGNQLCTVLIVEQIFSDESVVAKYAWGRNPYWGITHPGVIPWQGKIAHGALTLSQPRRTLEYRLIDHDKLEGVYISRTKFRYDGVYSRRQ